MAVFPRCRTNAIAVPAGNELTALVMPEAGYDPSVYVVRGPATSGEQHPLPCVAGSDRGGRSEPETLTYTNTGTADETVFLIVDSYAPADAGGAFAFHTSVVSR